VAIAEVTSENGRRGRSGRRSGRRRGRQTKNEIPGTGTAQTDAGRKTNLRQAIEQQQRQQALEAETTTASGSGDERQLPWLPVPTGNEPSAAPPGDDDDNENTGDDWDASGNDESEQPNNN